MRHGAPLILLAACAPAAPAAGPQAPVPTEHVALGPSARFRLRPAQLVATPHCTAPSKAPASDYPTKYRLFSPQERAARASQLQQTGYWSFVDIDDYGFVRLARAKALGDVPALVPNTPLPEGWRLDDDELAAWAQILPCDPAPFGLEDARPPSFTKLVTDSFLAVQPGFGKQGIALDLGVRVDFPDPHVSHQGKTVWNLSVSGHWWPGAALPPAKVKVGTVVARVVGRTYDVTWQLGPPPCVQGVACPPGAPMTTVEQAAPQKVNARQAVVAVRRTATGPAELREVIRVDVTGSNGPLGANAKPRDGAPILPYFVDAVTGEDLSAWPCGFAGDLCGLYFGP